MNNLLIISILLTVAYLVSGYTDRIAQTPFGAWPASCVHHVDDPKAEIEDDFKNTIIHFSNGTKKIIPACPIKSGLELEQDGWVAYAVWQAPSTITSYIGQWTVPQNPAKEEVQTLFLFTGLQNAYMDPKTNELQGVSIIQPVLQWGESEAGGGEYWTVASWFVGSNAVYSTLAKVSAGDTILGKMVFNKNTTWSIIAIDQTSPAQSGLNVKTGTMEPYAFVSLEVYGVQDCGDYPNGATTFSKLALLDGSKNLKPQWNPQVVQQCSEAVQVVNPTTITVKF